MLQVKAKEKEIRILMVYVPGLKQQRGDVTSETMEHVTPLVMRERKERCSAILTRLQQESRAADPIDRATTALGPGSQRWAV